MFTRLDLEELVRSNTQDQKVLSLYFSTDLAQHLKEERRLALKKLLDGVGEDAKQDIERVQRFFDQEFDWQSLGVALFTSAAADFWKVVRLATPVYDYAVFQINPNVRPLADLLDRYECYGVALVDRGHARFFAIQLGEMAEYERALPPIPGRHRQGGWNAARLQRHTDALAFQNLKQAAQMTTDFHKSLQCSHLLIAGTDDMVAQFRVLLPKALQKRIAGEFAVDIHAPAGAVLNKARQLVERTEQERDLAQVQVLCAAAKKRRPTGALGLADTLGALLEGKVMTLVTSAGYRTDGFACSHCGFLAAQSLQRCPLCGSAVQHVDEMVDLAVHKALECGSRVQTVYGPAAVELETMGGIGALLRF